MAKQVFNTKVSLTDQQVGALMKGFTAAVRDIDAVQTTAQEACAKIADGGLLIPAPVLGRIEKILDKVDDPVEIAEAVEDGAGKEGDNIVVSMTLDPIYLIHIKEKAKACGLTVDVLASQLQSQILHMGMLIDMPTETMPIYLTPEQMTFVREKMKLSPDEPLFGDTLARHFGWKPEGAESEVDLFADSTVGA